MDIVNMTWSTPSTNCTMIDHYTVTVSNDSSVVEQTQTTNLTILIKGIQQKMNYSFTVKAIDSIGREGNTSESVTFLFG